VSDTVKKVIAWRLISFVVAMIYNLVFLGGWQKSFLLTVALMTVLTVIHYAFEKWWDKALMVELADTGDLKSPSRRE
jgi:uncharacterized membrane protein